MLEYDDARSGSFEALREAPEDKTIVLGLATTKSPPLESAHDLQARIHEAERYAPLERLALSPQCGFSTSIVGNRISIEEEQRKLVRIVEVAQAVWGSV